MPYIGKDVATAYQSTTAVQRFNGDGSDTTFTLTTAVSSVQDVLVSVDGVVQDTAAENKGNFKGGGLFRTNAQSLTANITILATENANVTGPFTVASGVTLTIESGGTLVTL